MKRKMQSLKAWFTATPAKAVRAASGGVAQIVANRPSGSRRGSFLVLVVGTLALLAVVAIVYVAIGNQDTRVRAAADKRERIDDMPQKVADYIGSIIAYDRLDLTWDDAVTLGGLRIRRETTDYPYTNWNVLTAPGNDPELAFNPVGAGLATGVPALSLRPSDPWLASTRPVYLDFNAAGLTDPERPYLDTLDWAQISNFAPDGAFVNLVNLRNNFNANPLQMRQNRTLYDAASGAPGATNLDFGAAIDTNVVAHTTMRQVKAFRPMQDALLPSSVNHIKNQWADTDGDGFADSRWFQLVEKRDLNPATGWSNLLPDDGTYRYFIAARAIDLSGLVNINTATDFLAQPVANNPVGLSPGDVDLKRLLQQHDVFDVNAPLSNPGALGGYDGVRNPPANTNTNPALPGFAENYTDYNRAQSLLTGNLGYQALRNAFAAGIVPPAAYRGNLLAAANPATPAAFQNDYRLPPATGALAVNEWRFATTSSQQRTRFYNKRWVSFVDTFALNDFTLGTSEYVVAGPFGLPDLEELLTRHRVNSPEFTSNLELALDGRDNSGSNPDPTSTIRFGPLRSNRGLELELPPATAFNPANPANEWQQHLLLVDSDVRQYLTTLSGATPFRPYITGTPFGVDPNRISGAEVMLNAQRLLDNPTFTGGFGRPDARSLFAGYSEALAPLSGITGVWDRAAPAVFGRFKTLFYGHDGPELAILASAHMAVNAADSFDPDTVPSVYTLLLDERYVGTRLQADAGLQLAEMAYPAWHAHQRLDLNDIGDDNDDGDANDIPDRGTRLASSVNSVVHKAVNIYGVEPQPFLTQVLSFTAYTDAPASNGGDTESDTDPRTIRGNLTHANKDALFRVVAFKITNPFEVDITLSSAAAAAVTNGKENGNSSSITGTVITTDEDFFYVQLGGRYFKLAQLNEQVGPDGNYRVPAATDPLTLIDLSGVTVPAGKSVVFYALSDTPRRILEERLSPSSPQIAGGTISKLPSTIRRIIENTLDGSADITGVYWMPEFQPDTTLTTTTADDLPVSQWGEILLPRPGEFDTLVSASRPDVALWRAIRTRPPAAPTGGAPELTSGQGDVVAGGAASALQAEVGAARNVMANDQLVDRFRIPAGTDLDRKLPNSNIDVDGSDSGNLRQPTIAVWSSARRPADPSGQAPLGQFPAYCLEPKPPRAGDPAKPDWNISEEDPFGDISDPASALNLTDFSGNQPAADDVLNTWRIGMSGGAPMIETAAEAPQQWPTAESIESGSRPIAQVPTTGDYTANAPQMALDNARFRRGTGAAQVSVLRITDMLLPMGIGPMETPVNPANGLLFDRTDPARWTTLGQALSMALGYEGIATTPATSWPKSPEDLTWLYRPTLFPAGHPLAAQPRLPFDRGHLRLDDYAPFYDENANGVFETGSDDQTVGVGQPLSLNVLDQFIVAPGDLLSATRVRPGVVNINTAPLNVLRTLPMLSPLPDTSVLGETLWWWGGATSPLNQSSDIAATVEAYRDKRDGYLRPQSQVLLGGVPVLLTFADLQPPNTPIPPDQPELANGRSFSSQINGLGEQPGMQSIGALGTVRLRIPGLPNPNAAPFNIDFMGFNTTGGNPPGNSGREGVDSILFTTGSGPQPDDMANDYKEKLAVLGGVAGSVTTRSDYFAVWFVIHGYRESDVVNLSNNDPMVPSIARRFLMVVDRSNVTQRGQSPRIVLFKELPYTP